LLDVQGLRRPYILGLVKELKEKLEEQDES
jgi:hypothetical protein